VLISDFPWFSLKLKITCYLFLPSWVMLELWKEVFSHNLSMDYTMVQSIYIKNKYVFIKNHLLSVDQWLSLIFLKIKNFLLVGNFPMQGGSRLIVVEAATAFYAALFTSRYKNTFYKFSYSFRGKTYFLFLEPKLIVVFIFQPLEDLGNFPMHTKVAQVSMLQLLHPETKKRFIIFHTPSGRKKYFL